MPKRIFSSWRIAGLVFLLLLGLFVIVTTYTETIAALREQALTDKQLQDEIEAVRVDLFQYIFERTEAVERLQAYIRELQERSMQ